MSTMEACLTAEDEAAHLTSLNAQVFSKPSNESRFAVNYGLEYGFSAEEFDTLTTSFRSEAEDLDDCFEHGKDVDKETDINIVGAFLPLKRMIEELLATASDAQASLKEDPSKSNAEQVALEMLEKITSIVNSHIEVAKLPTKSDLVRQKVLNAYTTLAKKLGRNSPASIKADTKLRIRNNLGGLPAYSRAEHGNMAGWIKHFVYPIIDDDMREVASELDCFSHERDSSLSVELRKKAAKIYDTLETQKRRLTI